ncbi:hypothetical protein [Falsiroseomonas sp.]|uniref:hypothetical protein n=1 Tax=Falsiroseomonas sp. TaxID=2870721 RepID=UPI0035639799
MTGNPNRPRAAETLRRIRAAGLAAALLFALTGCEAVREVDEAMRRVDVLDRLFEPDRFPPMAPAPPLPSLPPQPAPALPPPDPATDPAILAEPLPSLPPAEPVPATGREAPPAATEAASADPALRTTALLRSNPWLTRFWSALSGAQQERVARRLQAGRAPMLRTEIATAWDRMGLDERVRLIYGDGTGA